MAIRLQEMHPAFVHLPIALLPLAVGADVIGCLTDNKSALSFGQKAICIAAAGAVASAVTGLIAGEEINVEGASEDMLSLPCRSGRRRSALQLQAPWPPP